MKGITVKKHIAILLLAGLVLSFSACKGIELENKAEQVEEYSREQAMIFIANERNRYENAYSEGIWKIEASEDGTTFDRLVVQNVKDFLEVMKLLCMLAEERNVSVTSSEKDLIRQMTDTYMESLTEGDFAYIGCSREDVQKMYTELFTADKMARELTSVTNTEISDSEVKVIRIMQIVTEDVKKAKAILKRIKIDGANFNSMASRYTESPDIELVLMKGKNGDLIEKTAFSLEEGQVSNILCKDGLYYIIRCTDGYDEEATISRKQGLRTAVDSLRFYEVIEPYRKEHNIVFFDRFWSETSFSGHEDSVTESFFDIYHQYAD